MNPTHIFVTAPEGRKTPISPTDGSDARGVLLCVEAGTVCRVRYSQEVRRAIARGDLFACTFDGKRVITVTDVASAAAPKPLEELVHKDDAPFVAGDRLCFEELAEAKAKAKEQAAAKAKAEQEAKAAAAKAPINPSTSDKE